MLDEINPIYLALSLFGGLIALFVMKNVEVGLIFKIGAFVGTLIICYIMVDFMTDR